MLAQLDSALAGRPARVLIVDDGSTAPLPETFRRHPYKTLEIVEVLRLRRNLGHQRALAIGFVHILQNTECEAVVVMDSDGEDRPMDVPRMLAEFAGDPTRILFAARMKRLDRPLVRLSYHGYRLVHRVLVGLPVRIGNFSVIPHAMLGRLAVTSEIWNHYAAAVLRARLGHRETPIDRGPRLAGSTKMPFVNLLIHGLGALSVYGDIVGARLFTGTLLMIVLTAVLMVSLPRWAAAFLAVILVQALVFSFLLVFTIIGNRTAATFLPVRDCPYFVEGVETLFRRTS